MPRYSLETPIGIGDVLVTREGPWYVSAAIRLGAAMLGTPAFCNHVIIVHHRDADGAWWGIEGRPSGVGWVNLNTRLDMRLTNANNDQPKNEDQRYLIAKASETLFNTPYDWGGISVDVAEAFRVQHALRDQIKEWADGETPSHVVCSSFADWAYETVGLPNPGGNKRTRFTTPGDWDRFMLEKEWL